MPGIFTDYWRIVKPAPAKTQYTASSPEVAKLYSNFSWYTKIMKGAASRFAKYAQYKNMDNDVFVSRALDTIAEEMTQPSARTKLPFEIAYQNESDGDVPDAVSTTIRAALRHWVDVQDLNTLLFDIARTAIKYGDCFFRKASDLKKWQYVDPNDVIGISVDKDGKPEHYHVRHQDVSRPMGGTTVGEVAIIPAAGIVHFTRASSMDDNGPFGESVLQPCVRAFRHLSLLEDSVIIYRIVRAPERRVFFLDVGHMPPQRVKAFLEAVKTEMKQKRIPNETGGTDKIDSVFNPMSMTEDYFFAQTADGRGSKVETLSGGENLGEIADLNYFQNKFLQGLRIPSSYMRGGNDGGIAIADGKVGIAYIEEVRFANYVGRLQSKINDTFDQHFKAYLKSAGINIDHHLFKLRLVDPQNFLNYRDAEVADKMISNYNAIKDIKVLSEQFKLERYLSLTEDEIQENEILLKKERCIPEEGLGPRLTAHRMMYDPQWQENLPDIKVPESFEDHTKTEEGGGGEEGEELNTDEMSAPGEEGEEGKDAPEGEEGGGEEETGGDEPATETEEDTGGEAPPKEK